MSSIPLISHRMLVAAVAQERRPDPLLPREDSEPIDKPHTIVEVLDPADWDSSAAEPEPDSASVLAEDI